MQWFQINCGQRDEEERDELKFLANEPTFVPGSKYYCNIYVECEVLGVAMVLDMGEAPSFVVSPGPRFEHHSGPNIHT